MLMRRDPQAIEGDPKWLYKLFKEIFPAEGKKKNKVSQEKFILLHLGCPL